MISRSIYHHVLYHYTAECECRHRSSCVLLFTGFMAQELPPSTNLLRGRTVRAVATVVKQRLRPRHDNSDHNLGTHSKPLAIERRSLPSRMEPPPPPVSWVMLNAILYVLSGVTQVGALSRLQSRRSTAPAQSSATPPAPAQQHEHQRRSARSRHRLFIQLDGGQRFL